MKSKVLGRDHTHLDLRPRRDIVPLTEYSGSYVGVRPYRLSPTPDVSTFPDRIRTGGLGVTTRRVDQWSDVEVDIPGQHSVLFNGRVSPTPVGQPTVETDRTPSPPPPLKDGDIGGRGSLGGSAAHPSVDNSPSGSVRVGPPRVSQHRTPPRVRPQTDILDPHPQSHPSGRHEKSPQETTVRGPWTGRSSHHSVTNGILCAG